MKNRSIFISIVCFSSLIGCVHTPPQKALEERSEYDLVRPEEQLLDLEHTQSGAELKDGRPVRRKPKIADIWVHPYEISKREYFHGGWTTIVIDSDDSSSVLRRAVKEPLLEAKPHE